MSILSPRRWAIRVGLEGQDLTVVRKDVQDLGYELRDFKTHMSVLEQSWDPGDPRSYACIAERKGRTLEPVITYTVSDQRRMDITERASKFPRDLVDALAERAQNAGATVVDARELGPATPNRDLE